MLNKIYASHRDKLRGANKIYKDFYFSKNIKLTKQQSRYQKLFQGDKNMNEKSVNFVSWAFLVASSLNTGLMKAHVYLTQCNKYVYICQNQ